MTEQKKTRKKRKDPRIEKEYFEEVEVTNPKTGEKTIQKVKITRYKAAGGPQPVGNKGLSEELEEDLELSWSLEDED